MCKDLYQNYIDDNWGNDTVKGMKQSLNSLNKAMQYQCVCIIDIMKNSCWLFSRDVNYDYKIRDHNLYDDSK